MTAREALASAVGLLALLVGAAVIVAGWVLMSWAGFGLEPPSGPSYFVRSVMVQAYGLGLAGGGCLLLRHIYDRRTR